MPATFFGRNVKESVGHKCPITMSEHFNADTAAARIDDKIFLVD